METLVHLGLTNAALAVPLAALAGVVGALVRRPALAHGLWLLVLLKLLTPPLVPVPVPWPPDTGPSPAATAPPVADEGPAVATGLAAGPRREPDGVAAPVPVAPGDVDTAAVGLPHVDDARAGPPPALGPLPGAGTTAAPAPPPPWQWESYAAALWLAGSAGWLGLAGFRLLRFRRSLRRALAPPAGTDDEVRRLAARLGLRRCPPVRLLPAAVPPLVWSPLGRPRLLVPAGLWGRLGADQRRAVLAHELAHVRRRDHWVRWLELAALALYWWHPVAWWARRRLREAEEECCDAWVVWALPGSAEAYARALVEAVGFLSVPRPALPPAASGMGQVPFLKRRLTMVMTGTTPRSLGRAGRLAVLGLAGALLPLVPGWGQAPPTPTAPAPAAPGAGAPPAPGEAAAPGLPGLPPPPAAAPAAEEEQTAREEVELLKAALDGRDAEVQEAKALLVRAQRQLDRQNRLMKSGAISSEEVEQARSEVEVQQAKFRAKEAQSREAALRLRQAERRLSRLRQSSAAPAGAAPGLPPGAEGGAGPKPGGSRPPGAAGGGALPGATPATSAAPGNRYTDVTTASGTAMGKHPTGSAAAASDARVRDLEKKVEALVREVGALRQEVRRQRGRPGTPDGRPADPLTAPAPGSPAAPVSPPGLSPPGPDRP